MSIIKYLLSKWSIPLKQEAPGRTSYPRTQNHSTSLLTRMLAKCCPPFTYIGGPKGRTSISVLGGYHIFYNTHQIWFSENKFIKRSGFHLFSFPLKFTCWARVPIYIISSQYVDPPNFENSQFSQTRYYLLIDYYF